jgi:hypothetical protein
MRRVFGPRPCSYQAPHPLQRLTLSRSTRAACALSEKFRK